MFREQPLRRRLNFRLSVAFLDVSVKNGPVASEWLERGAVRWSDPIARLDLKYRQFLPARRTRSRRK